MSSEKTFPVVEVFGPTLQGEGMLAGKVSHFIRLGGCDFTCLWCDSSHAVLPKHVRTAPRLTTDDILDRVRGLPGRPEWVTISGGNPALHDLTELVSGLHNADFKVAVETQGSRWKEWLANIDLLTISPKPPSSGMANEDLRGFLRNVEQYARDACLKVPVFDQKDLDFARELHHTYPSFPFYLSVVTRMGGLFGDFDGGAIDTTEDTLSRYKWLVEAVLANPAFGDITIFPQLHVLLWGHTRGH